MVDQFLKHFEIACVKFFHACHAPHQVQFAGLRLRIKLNQPIGIGDFIIIDRGKVITLQIRGSIKDAITRHGNAQTRFNICINRLSLPELFRKIFHSIIYMKHIIIFYKNELEQDSIRPIQANK